ncbi:MAG TPA: class I SAM-dependent methyltransferase [Candidatus Thermoplasmatota archaeon]
MRPEGAPGAHNCCATQSLESRASGGPVLKAPRRIGLKNRDDLAAASVMTCPHCEGAQKIFSDRTAKRDLRRFQKKGPAKTTQILFDLVPADAWRGASVLDIGGGIGAIQHEAIRRGADRVTDVDASPAYLALAKAEAARRGYSERATYRQGDFVELAPTIPAADLVTLDRVVCCYPHADALLTNAGKHARRFVALVWPRDRWWTRLLAGIGNMFLRLTRNEFRAYIHPDAVVTDTLLRQGLSQRAARTAGYWQVRVYERATVMRNSLAGSLAPTRRKIDEHA